MEHYKSTKHKLLRALGLLVGICVSFVALLFVGCVIFDFLGLDSDDSDENNETNSTNMEITTTPQDENAATYLKHYFINDSGEADRSKVVEIVEDKNTIKDYPNTPNIYEIDEKHNSVPLQIDVVVIDYILSAKQYGGAGYGVSLQCKRMDEVARERMAYIAATYIYMDANNGAKNQQIIKQYADMIYEFRDHDAFTGIKVGGTDVYLSVGANNLLTLVIKIEEGNMKW